MSLARSAVSLGVKIDTLGINASLTQPDKKGSRRQTKSHKRAKAQSHRPLHRMLMTLRKQGTAFQRIGSVPRGKRQMGREGGKYDVAILFPCVGGR